MAGTRTDDEETCSRTRDEQLAWRLRREHNHASTPRLVVPGWIGIASIKRLGQIEVADRPPFSPSCGTR